MRRVIAILLACALCCQATDFVTSATVTVTRNNFTGHVGFKFTVGAAPLYVSALGRRCTAGNSATHNLYITRVSDSAVMAAVSVSMSGCTTGVFVFGAAPCTLAASTAYYASSSESSGADLFGDDTGTTLTTTADATGNGSVYTFTAPASPPTGFAVNTPGASASYAPPSFRYSLSPSSGSNSRVIVF